MPAKAPVIIRATDTLANRPAPALNQTFYRKRFTGCINKDDTLVIFRYTTVEECQGNCEIDNCLVFEFEPSSGDCFLHHSKCQESSSEADLYVRDPPEGVAREIEFECSNGDRVAAALMKTLLPESEIQAHLHMGTQSFGAAPEVCQERVKNVFCRYNSEFRSAAKEKAPIVPRVCELKKFPTFDTTSSLRQRCNLNRTKEDAFANVAYIIMVHGREVFNLKRLLTSIDDVNNTFVIHVDAKDSSMDVESSIPVGMLNRVKVISTEEVLWGGSSLLRAYLAGLRALLEMKRDWGYVVNLSGSDYPLLTQREIRRFLGSFAWKDGVNFIDFGTPHTMFIPPWLTDNNGLSHGIATELTTEDIDNKVHRVTGVVSECKEDGNVYPTVTLRRIPKGVDWREGSFWHILHRSFVDSMFYGADQNLTSILEDYFDVLSNPDETFFQTLLMNSEHCTQVCPANLRFENWHQDINPMHPISMSLDDVDASYKEMVMKQGVHLFARKFAHHSQNDFDVLSYVDLLRQNAFVPDDLK